MSFWRWIKREQGKSAPAASAPKASEQGLLPVTVAIVAPGDLEKPGQPIYPPVDNGIRIRPGRELVAAHHEMVRRLRQHVSLPPADFERKYLQPINRLADFIGLLPASNGRHHAGAGGLFAYALHMGVLAARSADGMLFAASEGPERRRNVEQAWRHAAFLTALSCDLYRPLTEMQVVAPSGETWSPFLGGLHAWAQAQGADRVYVRWTPEPAPNTAPSGRGVTAWALNAIVGEQLLAALHSVRPEIVSTMAALVTGTLGPLTDHPLARTLNKARKAALDLDEALNPQLYGKLTQGAHLEPLILDSLRMLVSSGKWAVNKGKAGLQYGRDGLFVVWPIGAKHLQEDLAMRGVQGVPGNPATLAEMMMAGGIVARAGDGTPYHSVSSVDSLKGGERDRLIALRFVRAESVLAGIEEGELPVPFDAELIEIRPAAEGQVAAPPIAAKAGAAKPEELPSGQHQALTPGFTPPPRKTNEGAAPAVSASSQRATKSKEDTAEEGVATQVADGQRPNSPVDSQPGDRPDEGAATAAPSEQGKPGPAPAASQGPPDGIPSDIVVCLGVPLARAIARFRDAFNASRATNGMVQVDSGVAISLQYALDNSGLAPGRFQEPLKEHGFLVLTAPTDGGKARPLHPIQINGVDTRAYVLSKKFASRCGFVLT